MPSCRLTLQAQLARVIEITWYKNTIQPLLRIYFKILTLYQVSAIFRANTLPITSTKLFTINGLINKLNLVHRAKNNCSA